MLHAVLALPVAELRVSAVDACLAHSSRDRAKKFLHWVGWNVAYSVAAADAIDVSRSWPERHQEHPAYWEREYKRPRRPPGLLQRMWERLCL